VETVGTIGVNIAVILEQVFQDNSITPDINDFVPPGILGSLTHHGTAREVDKTIIVA
jgi:hypothetical protein